MVLPVVHCLKRLNCRVGREDIYLLINRDLHLRDLHLNDLDSKNPDAKMNQTETSIITQH